MEPVDGAGEFGGNLQEPVVAGDVREFVGDRKSTRLNSSHGYISYAVFCLKKKKHNSFHRPQSKDDDHNGQDHNSDTPDPAPADEPTKPHNEVSHAGRAARDR